MVYYQQATRGGGSVSTHYRHDLLNVPENDLPLSLPASSLSTPSTPFSSPSPVGAFVMDNLSTVIKKLHIHTLNDWYHVPTSYIRLAEPQLLKKYPFYFYVSLVFVCISAVHIHCDWSIYNYEISLIYFMYPTVEDIVKANYPEHKWSHNKFQTAVARIKYSTPQLFLERITRYFTLSPEM